MPVFYTLIAVLVGVGLLALFGMYTSSVPVSFDRYSRRRAANEVQPYSHFNREAFQTPQAARPEPGELPPKRMRAYRRKSAVLTGEESRLLEALRVVCGRNYAVLVKVALPELVELAEGIEGVYASEAFGKMRSRHAGFVVVVAATWEPVCAVELDYPPEPGTRQAVRFGDHILESAGIPVFGVPLRASYDLGVLRLGLHAAIARGVGLRQFLRNA